MYRVAGLVLVCLASCSVERVEHASTAVAGGTLDVTLHLQGGGEHLGQAMVCAGLPAGWQVESASYSASADGVNPLSGPAVRHPDQEGWFGSNPAVSWSCWVHEGTQSWSDASSGQVDLVVRVGSAATGRSDLFWTLGSSGTMGEYISARAQTVVTVGQGAHPLDALALNNGGLDVTATGAHPSGFVAVSASSLLLSTDGVNWASMGPGLPGATAVSADSTAVYAIAGGQLWSYTDEWQVVALSDSTTVDAVFTSGENVLVCGQTPASEYGMWELTNTGPTSRVVPADVVEEALSVSANHAAWLAWDSEARVHYAWVRTALDGAWTAVAGPVVDQAQAITDRVGVSSDGTLLWLRARTDSTGSHLQVWDKVADADWRLVASLPTGDLAVPHVPRATDNGWLFYDGWGAVWSVEGDDVARHPLARTPDDGQAVVSGEQVIWVEAGRPVGATEWVPAPSIGGVDLESGRVGDPYVAEVAVATEATLQASGLPEGLRILDRRIVGTPEQSGVFPVTLVAEDAWGREAVVDAELTVADAILPDEPFDPDTDVDTDTWEDDTDAWEEDTDVWEDDTDPMVDDTGASQVDGSGCSSMPISAGWLGLFTGLVGLMMRRRSRR